MQLNLISILGSKEGLQKGAEKFMGVLRSLMK